jgi:hypothetical protein
MPKINYVKKARKPNSVVTQDDINRANSGEEGAASYYWWAMKTAYSSVKRLSKTKPRPSQTTLSDFYSAVYGLQEEVEDAEIGFDDCESFAQDIAERIREIGGECREKFDNLPEGFQQGSSGELLEERAEACESAADEIEGVTVPCEDDFDGDDNDALEDWKSEQVSEFLSEITDALGNIG